ncbi:hypothetical protein [Streptomyces qinzhouensis]|uniref:Uncharacterized protein n=1 Tax=Streptomyces qinzhouensis TaxID=2599401 RepID=A0A5B8IBW3_9ACTN|nr:hypothetical protein [Streptomyces qinzhouensis]QDY75192.1 hypothetical protein FQU76_00330 [Streptomyces qinzhouensis]QDY80606.1 hypothetical protein FQU76_33410 [Streptomyces qinzhouensis]
MTFPLCPRGHVRDSESAAGSVLCGPCLERVEGRLRALPALYRECLYLAAPAVRRTNPTKVSASRNRDHLDIAVLDTRHRVRTLLESWSGMVVEKLVTAPPPRTVPHLARFLGRHLGWLAAQPSAVDFADEIEGLVAELRRTIDPEPADPRALIRRCVVDGCAGTISAPPRGVAGAGRIACSAGHSWELVDWLGLRKLMERQREDVEG